MDRLKDYDCAKSCPTPKCVIRDDEEVDIAQLVARLRHLVLVHRIRVSPFMSQRIDVSSIELLM